MRLCMPLPTSHPGLPTSGTRDSLKECFKGHPLPFTADTGSGISCSAQGWRGGRTAPHRRDPGFPEETERILKTGSGVGKAELLGQRIRLRTKWQPTPVFLPRESSGQRSLSMGSHRVGTAWGGATERWGDNFQQMCPRDLVTSVLYLLPGVSEAEGGVCKSVSLAAKIQPFPHLSLSLECSLSPQGALSPVCVVLSVLLSSPEPSRKSRCLCLL